MTTFKLKYISSEEYMVFEVYIRILEAYNVYHFWGFLSILITSSYTYNKIKLSTENCITCDINHKSWNEPTWYFFWDLIFLKIQKNN